MALADALSPATSLSPALAEGVIPLESISMAPRHGFDGSAQSEYCSPIDAPSSDPMWDSLGFDKGHGALGGLPVPDLSPSGTTSSLISTSPPITPAGRRYMDLTSTTLRSPKNAVRYSPIGTSSRKRSGAEADASVPRSKPPAITVAHVANACIPDLTPKRVGSSASATSTGRQAPHQQPIDFCPALGPVNFTEAFKALELVETFLAERRVIEQYGHGAGLTLVTSEAMVAVEQLRGRVAAALQIEKLKAPGGTIDTASMYVRPELRTMQENHHGHDAITYY